MLEYISIQQAKIFKYYDIQVLINARIYTDRAVRIAQSISRYRFRKCSNMFRYNCLYMLKYIQIQLLELLQYIQIYLLTNAEIFLDIVTEGIRRKGQPRTQRKENCSWQCIIYHIKEDTLSFNMQESLALYYMQKKSYKTLKLVIKSHFEFCRKLGTSKYWQVHINQI